MPGHMVGNLRAVVSREGNGAWTALSARVGAVEVGSSRARSSENVCADKALRAPLAKAVFFFCLFVLSVFSTNAALQFDVFLGYDGVVPEASWFPITCEIKNDGPSFKGIVEITPDYGQGQTRRQEVELPTGTLKRVYIPVFCNAGYSSWDIRLIDERGKVRAEKLKEQALHQVSAGTPVLGAMMRNAGAKPLIRPLASEQDKPQPPSA